MKTKSHRVRFGFTMIELLVILAILVFVLGMLYPAIRQVQRAASRTNSLNNLRQLAELFPKVVDGVRFRRRLRLPFRHRQT